MDASKTGSKDASSSAWSPYVTTARACFTRTRSAVTDCLKTCKKRVDLEVAARRAAEQSDKMSSSIGVAANASDLRRRNVAQGLPATEQKSAQGSGAAINSTQIKDIQVTASEWLAASVPVLKEYATGAYSAASRAIISRLDDCRKGKRPDKRTL